MSQTDNSVDQSIRMEQYYRFHSKIYDLTRWSFLFGRKKIIDKLAAVCMPNRVLEVGCGTGKNLVKLSAAFPQAHITGLDISETMLNVARKKLASSTQQVSLIHKPYDNPLNPAGQPFDLVLFSYALTMINPGWEQAIDAAYQDLAQGGVIAVVDFHDSNFAWFKQWMGVNHVRMDGHLLPYLDSRFQSRASEVTCAYGCLWQYLLYIGEKQ